MAVHNRRLQRQLKTLLGNYRVLESRLEANGVSARSLQIQPMDLDLDGVSNPTSLPCPAPSSPTSFQYART